MRNVYERQIDIRAAKAKTVSETAQGCGEKSFDWDSTLTTAQDPYFSRESELLTGGESSILFGVECERLS